MEVHHLTGAHQVDQAKSKCFYCNTPFEVNKWKSYHANEIHYKVMACDCCGKVMSMRVDFLGSGHDSWHTKDITNEAIKEKGIEKEILKVEKEQENLELEKEIQQAMEKGKGLPFNVLVGKVIEELKQKADSKLIKDLMGKMQNNNSNVPVGAVKSEVIDNG